MRRNETASVPKDSHMLDRTVILLSLILTFAQQFPVDVKRCPCDRTTKNKKQERNLLTDCVCERESLPDCEFYLPRGKTSTLFLISWSWSTSLLRATAWLEEPVEEKQETDMNNTSSNV